MTRARLPGRRQSRTRTLTWTDGNDLHVFELTVGFDAAGMVREIFANSPKIRNQVKAQIDDALVVFSRTLQHGDTITGLAASLGREGLDPDSPAASIYGLMARAAVEIEAEEGPEVATMAAAEMPVAAVMTYDAPPEMPMRLFPGEAVRLHRDTAYAVLKAAHDVLLMLVEPIRAVKFPLAIMSDEAKQLRDAIDAIQRHVLTIAPGQTISDAAAAASVTVKDWPADSDDIKALHRTHTDELEQLADDARRSIISIQQGVS